MFPFTSEPEKEPPVMDRGQLEATVNGVGGAERSGLFYGQGKAMKGHESDVYFVLGSGEPSFCNLEVLTFFFGRKLDDHEAKNNVSIKVMIVRNLSLFDEIGMRAIVVVLQNEPLHVVYLHGQGMILCEVGLLTDRHEPEKRITDRDDMVKSSMTENKDGQHVFQLIGVCKISVIFQKY